MDPIDDRTAEATLEHGGVAASLTFHFDENDYVTKVHADERARRVADGYEPTPWTDHWHDYETRNGMVVPSAGTVVWHLPDGDVEAWRGHVTDTSYDGGSAHASRLRSGITTLRVRIDESAK